MIYAVIDLGSNTIRMNVYRLRNGKFRLLFSKKATAGIVSYVKDGRLNREGICEICSTLESFKKVLEHLQIEQCSVFATASLRNIDNTEEVITQVKKKTGMKICLISGEEEGRLSFRGAAIQLSAEDGLFIDIGGGTTEVAVIAMGGIVVSQSIRVAGDEFDQAILTHVRDAYNLAIGERTAEDIKIKVGSAVPLKDELDVEVNGRDVISGLPKTVRIESEEIRRALNKPLDEMSKAVKDALDATPPDLASDLMYYGILLTGGGAMLRGLDVRLRDETGVAVNVSPTALDNVVNGCARVLEANAFDGGFVQSNA